jgi:hypothetical protein
VVWRSQVRHGGAPRPHPCRERRYRTSRFAGSGASRWRVRGRWCTTALGAAASRAVG